MRPTERRTAPDRVADIQPGAALDEKLHHGLMVAQDCLVQRRGVGEPEPQQREAGGVAGAATA